MKFLRCLLLAGNLILFAAIFSGCLSNQDEEQIVTTPPVIAFTAGPTASPTIQLETQTATLRSTKTATITTTQTRIPSPTSSPTPFVHFAVIGDFGLAGVAEADTAELVLSWIPDLIITTGDNNYPAGAGDTIDANIGQYYHAFIFPYSGDYGEGSAINRFFPTLGNHDLTTDKGEPYFEYFELPGNERYYDFVWGPVHFFALNSDSREPDGVGRSSVQAEWLKLALSESTTPWQVVYMHHPPYSSSGDGPIDWIQWPFKDWGADVIISGHSHIYERLEIEGLIYIVNGLGGGPIYGFDQTIDGSQVRFNDDYGAMLVEVTEQKITFQFITRAGVLIDEFVIEH